MSRHNRHPRRTWFGDVPVRTLADAEAEAKQNSRVGGLLPAGIAETPGVAPGPTLDPTAAALAQCERQAQSLFADRLLQPDQLRKKYPSGWLGARYVAPPAALASIPRRGGL